jgi:hypothetical protein
MDHQWFDNLTRAIAPVSRRDSLKVLASSLAGRMVPALGVGVGVFPSRAAADERPTHPEITPETIELLPYQDAGYRFRTIPLGASPPSGWEQAVFDESDFNTGQGAFGSGGDCPLQSTVHTMWPAGSELLARIVVDVPPGATGLRIMVSVDNDIRGIFFDGHSLADFISHDECPIQDEFRFDVPSSLATPGRKLVAFHVLDRGEESFFDARMLAEVPRKVFARSSCSRENFVNVPCEQLNDYIRDCGVFCPDGTQAKGEGGCTVCNIDWQRPPLSPTFEQNPFGFNGVCASAVVNVSFVDALPGSTVIDYQPTVCCEQQCKDEIAEVTAQLRAHEDGHQAQKEAAITKANRDWKARRLTSCGKDRQEAEKRLVLDVSRAIQDTVDKIVAECRRHPRQARPIECAKCVPARQNQSCISGKCVESPCSRSSQCPRVIDCSRGGKICLCLTTAEGDIRCGAPRGSTFCLTTVPCVTTQGCENFLGAGWFCQQPGTGCCGCAHSPSGQPACGDTGVCVPPC